MKPIAEKDWKLLRAWKKEKLEITCNQMLDRLATITADREAGSHQAYLKLFEAIREEDHRLGDMFDDLKRSSAMLKLAYWERNGLLSEQELAQLSDETRSFIQRFKELV